MLRKIWILMISCLVLFTLVGCSKTVDEPVATAPQTPEEAIEQAQENIAEEAVAYTEFNSVKELKEAVPVELLAKEKVVVSPVLEGESEFTMVANYITKANDGTVADVVYFPENPEGDFFVANLRQSTTGVLDSKVSVEEFSTDYNDYPVETELRMMEEGIVVNLYGTEDGIFLADWVNSNLKSRYALILSAPTPAGVVESLIKELYR